MAETKANYHHGDLRECLLNSAMDMLNQFGIEGLSLRKLADKVGVSRTAPYHHFSDKNALLCALAEQGFVNWREEAILILEQPDLSLKVRFHQFFLAYIHYAANNANLYDLMFGRTIWKQVTATDSLKSVAYPSFQFQVAMTKEWQAQGLFSQEENTLRLAQVTWGTMHGIARLLIDGIYADETHIDEMCACAVNLFIED